MPNIDLNQLTAEEIIELGYLLNEELEKSASAELANEDPDGDVDLNSLDVEDFIDFAAGVEDAAVEMEKEAGRAGAVKEWLKARGKGAVHRATRPVEVYESRLAALRAKGKEGKWRERGRKAVAGAEAAAPTAAALTGMGGLGYAAGRRRRRGENQ
jgi:hypothetical protein